MDTQDKAITPSLESMNLSPKWRERFMFFEQNGAPSAPSFQTAYKALPYKKKLLININFYAVFFGPIYFLILGMWKKALTILGLAVLAGVLGGVIEAFIKIDTTRGLGIAIGIMAGMTANYSYYCKTVKGENGWNIFKGLRP